MIIHAIQLEVIIGGAQMGYARHLMFFKLPGWVSE